MFLHKIRPWIPTQTLLLWVMGALIALAPSANAQSPPRLLKMHRFSNANGLLTMAGTADQNYQIQVSSDLLQWTPWRSVGPGNREQFSPFLAPTNQMFVYVDSALRFSGHRFYRAVTAAPTVLTGDHIPTGQGDTPESIAVAPDGTVYLGTVAKNVIKKVTPGGVVSEYPVFPAPGTATGVKVDPAGTVYVVKRSNAANTGVWKVSPDGTMTMFSNIPNTLLLNDLTFDDRGNLYVSDTFKGAVFKVNQNGQPQLWIEHALLLGQTPAVPPAKPFPNSRVGANGIAFSAARGVVYVMNTAAGSIIQIPVAADGSAGDVTVYVQDNLLVGGDGITLDAAGNIYVAANFQSRIAMVAPDRTVTTVAEGGLLNTCSSLAFSADGKTLFIANFAHPGLGGKPSEAGVLKMDMATKTITPVAYFNRDILIHHPRHSQHATVMMKWDNRTVYADPSVSGRPLDAATVFQGLPQADVIVITHIHADHYDTNTLKLLANANTAIVAPRSVFDLMPDSLKALTTVMANGETIEKAGVGIEAIPSYNLDPTRPFHPKGRDNGYVLTIGAKRIYIPGDTEDVPEMRALKNIDVAFLPMNLPFTMNEESAASAVREFKPKIIYPFHYTGFIMGATGPDFSKPNTHDVARFREIVGTDLGVEVRLRPWYEPLQMSDRIPAEQGDIVIQPVHHATVAMKWAGKQIYFDPAGDTAEFQRFPPANLMLVTHIHPDHYDALALAALKGTNTIILAPQNVFTNMPASLQSITTVMANGTAGVFNDIPVEAVAMYNLTPGRVGHPKGVGNGYVVTLGGKRIYVSGDTEDIPEMRALKNIDVAFVCMSVPSNMDVNQAASAVREFKPRIVYPYHTITPPRGFPVDGAAQDPSRLKQLVSDLGIEVRLRSWYSECH